MPDITLLQGAIESITANNLSDAKKHIESFIKQYDMDSWVDNASDEQLRGEQVNCPHCQYPDSLEVLIDAYVVKDFVGFHPTGEPMEGGIELRTDTFDDVKVVCAKCGEDVTQHDFNQPIKEDNMNDDKKLTALREKVRAALDAYEGALELALGGTTSGVRDYDDINTSLIQIQSARRVLWMDN
jgi:hypothetical protein